MTSVMWAALAGVAFVISHHAMSHHPVRQALVARTGEPAFAALYSVVSLIFYGPLVVLWWRNTATTEVWWANHGTGATTVASALIVAGFALFAGGILSPGRTSFAAKLNPTPATAVPRGMARFTRHPVFWGIVLVSVGHLMVDGGAIDVAFHGTNLAVGVIGGPHQDSRALRRDPAYAELIGATRLVPLPWPVPGAPFGWRTAVAVGLGVSAAAAARFLLH